jgi:hypothetical protein
MQEAFQARTEGVAEQGPIMRKPAYTFAAAPIAGVNVPVSRPSPFSSRPRARARAMRKPTNTRVAALINRPIVSLVSLFSFRLKAGAKRRSAYAIAAALIAAFMVSLLSLFSPQVQARAPEDSSVVEIVAVKGDRLDMPRLGSDCSQREWPYFEAACLRNAGNRATIVREPRVISVDRLPAQDAEAVVAAH